MIIFTITIIIPFHYNQDNQSSQTRPQMFVISLAWSRTGRDIQIQQRPGFPQHLVDTCQPRISNWQELCYAVPGVRTALIICQDNEEHHALNCGTHGCSSTWDGLALQGGPHFLHMRCIICIFTPAHQIYLQLLPLHQPNPFLSSQKHHQPPSIPHIFSCRDPHPCIHRYQTRVLR